MTTSSLRRDFQEVERRIAHACERSGRARDEVELVAVSKTVDAATVEAAAHLPSGSAPAVFGENRVQELMRKIDACPGVTFDLIGTLQRNKVSRVVGAVRLIHSVDSLRLLQAIDARARALGISQEVLLQINVSGEESKHGFAPEELPEVLEAAQPLSGVRVTGLMTMAPLGDPDAARPYFRRLRELSQDVGLDRLSMGMSDDFEVAIEEGATLIRVGSALFGSAESSAVLR